MVIIKQEKSDEKLTEFADTVISLLNTLNVAEKYKVINSLHSSLLDLIKSEGIVIELLKKK